MAHHDSERNTLDGVLDILIENGLEGMAEAMATMLNEAMKIERSSALRAEPGERCEERIGYANGFKLFPAEAYGSLSLNCFANTRNLDLPALNKILKTRHGLVIDGGYGKLKGTTFRISNMGDETDATIAELIAALDSALRELAT